MKMQQNTAILKERLMVGFGFIKYKLNPAIKNAKNLENEIITMNIQISEKQGHQT